MELDSKIYTLLRQVNTKMTGAISDMFAPTGITPPQAMILIRIHEQRTLRLSALADQLKMTYSNCSVITQRLERSGFITRIRDHQDQRVVNLALTAKSLKLIEMINKKMSGMESELLEGATLEERQKIYEGLVLLNKYINK